jgi:hypothetical protein
LPRKGEYGLEVFANDPRSDGDMFTHVAQYLVSYADRVLKSIYGDPSESFVVSTPQHFLNEDVKIIEIGTIRNSF